MKSHLSIRLGLVVALSLTTGIVTDAQTNWPTTKVVRPAAAPRPVQIRKPKPTSKRRAARTATIPRRQRISLRSMAELVTRQAAAIEALARRLEAAESRLDVLASASAPAAQTGQDASLGPVTPGFDDAQSPFRAALSIDWAEVIAR